MNIKSCPNSILSDGRSFERLLEKKRFKDVFEPFDKDHLEQIWNKVYGSNSSSDALLFLERSKSIKEKLGDSVFLYITNPESYPERAGDVTTALQSYLLEIEENIDSAFPYLNTFFERQTSLDRLIEQIDSLRKNFLQKKFPMNSFEEPFEAYFTKSSLVQFALDESEKDSLKKKFSLLESLGLSVKNKPLAELVAMASKLSEKSFLSEIDQLLLLSIGREAVRIELGIMPYSTQMIAILGILYHPVALKGRIAQVRTGEGKSTIAALLAFYFALQGRFVDVISSSSQLAQRDQKKYESFFSRFNIATSYLCSAQRDEQAFTGQIIYGTNYDFEFAFLFDALKENELQNIRNHKAKVFSFDVALVDEVDNLFIDTALNSARISIPHKNNHLWIYHALANFVQKNSEFVKNELKEESKKNLLQTIKKELEAIESGKYRESIAKFSEKQWETWLQSAYKAFYVLKEKEDYVVMPQQKSGGKLQDSIVIIDKENTGERQEKSRWQNGLHEFLEIKHRLKVSPEGLMPAAISHPIFFNMYKNIYGLTGTMGSHIERKEITDIYEIDSFDAPPHKPSQRKELSPKVLPTRESYYKALLEETEAMQQQKRPMLILLETIKETEELANFFKSQNMQVQLLNQRQPADENYIISLAGKPSAITIATNTAGRGTDIILSEESIKNGGLHLVFGFFPKNERVEVQGFGRAARQGQPGSVRMIILRGAEILDQNPLELLKAVREIKNEQLSAMRCERVAISQINHSYLTKFLAQLSEWHNKVNDSFFMTLKQHWALHFYNKLDELYEETRTRENGSSDHFIETYKKQIEDSYQAWRSHSL